MSDVSGAELLAIGDRIVAMAKTGEQVEVVVGRSSSTEVRVYEGDIEQLASATSAGIGVRVISDHRQGFAYAGSLDEDVLAETLAEARDNATFATPDEWLGLAEPDGVAIPDLDLYREALLKAPTDAKIDLAMELERALRAEDPRISGVESADYADGVSEGAVVSTTGIRAYGSETSCYVAASCVAQDGDDTQTGFGFSVGRSLEDLDVTVAAADASRRATRLLGATKNSLSWRGRTRGCRLRGRPRSRDRSGGSCAGPPRTRGRRFPTGPCARSTGTDGGRRRSGGRWSRQHLGPARRGVPCGSRANLFAPAKESSSFYRFGERARLRGGFATFARA